MDVPQWIKELSPTAVALVSACIALFSLCVGLAGFFLGVFNYRRDRSKVVVKLQWNAELAQADIGGGEYVATERWARIYVTNEGRRPVFITDVGLDLPGRSRTINRLNEGKGLAEGDPPIIIRVPQDKSLEPFMDNWQLIRATAGDSANRRYESKKVGERPLLTKGLNQEYASYMRPIEHEHTAVARGHIWSRVLRRLSAGPREPRA